MSALSIFRLKDKRKSQKKRLETLDSIMCGKQLKRNWIKPKPLLDKGWRGQTKGYGLETG